MLGAIAAGGALLGAYQSYKGGKAGEKAADRKSKNFLMSAAESTRRDTRANDRLMGDAIASTYASGVNMSGSNQQYLMDMADEFKREQDWTKRYGESVSSSIKEEAKLASEAQNWATAGNLLTQGANIYNTYWG
jgi:hypothetical protein